MKFISYESLREYGITAHATTIWRWERARQFPKRVQVSPGRIAWVDDEIKAWLAARIAARDVGSAQAAA